MKRIHWAVTLLVLGLTEIHAQSIQRVYGSPCVGVEMVFQFMGNCTVNYWTVNTGGTITYTSPDKKSIKVRYNTATTAFVSANYMNCGSGTANYPPFAVSALVSPSISISASTATTVFRSCSVSFTSSIVNGGSSPLITWFKNGVSQGTGNSFTHSNFNNGDVIQAQLLSNYTCLSSSTANSNSISVTVNEISVHSVSGTDVCPGQTTSIFLSGSQSGVRYDLYRNGLDVDADQFGSGSVLRWDNQPAATYSVVATVCSSTSNMGSPFVVNQRNPGFVGISSSVPPLLCSGSSITLTASGGSGYIWRSGGNIISSAASLALAPTQSMTVQLEGRESICQTQSYASMFIDVSANTVGGSTHALQTGQPSNTVCSGDFGKTTLAAGSYVGTILRWEYSFSSASGPYTDWGQAGNATTSESCCMGQPGETIYVRAVLKNGYCAEQPSSPSSYYWKPLPTPPTVPLTSPALTEFCQGTSAKFYSSASEGTLLWTVTGTGNSIDQNGNVQWAGDFSGTATVSSRTSNVCGPSGWASREVSVNLTSLGGNALSTLEQASYISLDKKDFGSTTLNSYRGNVMRWEYARSSEGPWNDWGQAQKVTTTTTCCIDKPGNSVWVRAVVKSGQCAETTSSAVRYSWGDEEENFIRTYTSRMALFSEDSLYDLSSIKEKASVQSQYFDGLGRISQVISKSASPDGLDLVEFHEYDAFGRELKKFLPYEAASTLGYLRSSPTAEQASFYSPSGGKENIPHDLFPYSIAVAESSPLNRALKQGAPGADWQPGTGEDHTVKTAYRFNASNEVLLWRLDTGTGLVTVTSGSSLRYYTANELRAVVITDENGSEVIEFTDKLGRTVLRKVQSGDSGGQKSFADTYYVYDDAGNLRVVIPPEAVANVHLISSEY